jgi:hypothetical protein
MNVHISLGFLCITLRDLRLEVSVYTLQTNFKIMFAQGSVGGGGSDCDSKEENS